MNASRYIDYSPTLTVSRAVETRRSIRAFLPRDVSVEVAREILEKSARAPSGTNMQPWRVYIVHGDSRQRLCDAVSHAFDHEQDQHQPETRYYPKKFSEPYISRRRKVGWDLYGLLGIAKGEREKTHIQHRRNYCFFDAPIGLIFTIDRNLETGSWLDYGMFLQNITLLAREAGLHTCPQVAWANYHRTIRSVLPIGDEEIIFCGMSLGYADTTAVENTLVTERCLVDEFVHVVD